MKEITDLIVAKRYAGLASSADSRGIEFALSLKKVKYLMKQKHCYYTGVPMSDEECPTQRTFDRVDNTKGYFDNNVVVCTREINMKKGTLTINEIKLLYNKIKTK